LTHTRLIIYPYHGEKAEIAPAALDGEGYPDDSKEKLRFALKPKSLACVLLREHQTGKNA